MTAERLNALFEQSGELARLLLKSPQPPRTLSAEFLHGRKRISSEEKALVSSFAHHAMRQWRYAAYCIDLRRAEVQPRRDSDLAPSVVSASILLSLEGTATAGINTTFAQQLLEVGIPDELLRQVSTQALMRTAGISSTELFERAQQINREAGTTLSAVAIRSSLPDWVAEQWMEVPLELSLSAIASIGHALAEPAPLTLRSNALVCTRDQLLVRLHELDIQSTLHSILPQAVIVQKRVSLTDSAPYTEGCFEVQDAGSQLIGHAARAMPGMHVYDACAGGGGKTMQLADMMSDQGHILASDIERNKLRGLRQRGARLNLHSLATLAITPNGGVQSRDESLPEEASQDLVLVDAPCSGFGTVRRNPALKWKLSPRTVMRLSGRQQEILHRNAAYVKPGGTLVYATCSLLPAENQFVIMDFLRAHEDFEEVPLAPVFAEQGITLPRLENMATQLMLHPALLDSDGYFMARLKKKS